MKTKTRSKQAEKQRAAASQKSAAEEKLQATIQRLRSHPSFVLGALIIIYCIVRLVFSI
jgi:beta-galactosidase/beta-glucuronidase